MSLKLSIKIGLFSSIFPLIAFAETYTVQKGDTLEKIARKFNVSVEEIKKANNIKDERKIRDGMKLEIPTKETNSKKETKKETKKTSKKESERNKELTYVVQKGDTLEEIAKKYGLTVKELMDYNGMKDEKIFAGDELKIPPKGAKIAQKQEQKEQEKRDLSSCEVYVLKRGGTLKHVSKKLGVSVKTLEKLNNISADKWLKAGEKICIGEKKEEKTAETTQKKASECTLVYRPKSTVSLNEISRKFNVSVEKLKKWNNLSKSTIPAGQEVCVAKEEVESEQATQEEKKTKIIVYKVKRGDTLEKIAEKFGVSKEDIISLNNLKREKVYYGQRLKIPATVALKTEQPEKPREKDKPEETQVKVETRQPPLPKPVEPKVVEKETVKLEGVKLSWPVKGNVVAKFQNDEQVRHLGIDIETDCGQSVKAAADGRVIYAGDGIKAFGNLVVIRHNNGLTTVYGYLDDISVREGKVVNRGDVIGKAGKLKNSDKCGIYFEVRKNVTPVDPLNILE
jgi:LysM repeat protein